MSILGKNRIIELMRRDQIEDRFTVTPLLDENQIGEASIDIRLGNNFVVTKRGNLPSVDPAKDDIKSIKYQSKQYIGFKNPFYLHPGELVLAGTLEYFRLPNDISAHVTSRSSWGRVGLVIATATAVHPGFTGVITLELVNHGEVPLVLYPGLSVAQIVLASCEGADAYEGRFGLKTDAHYPDIHRNEKLDLKFWTSD